MSRLRWVKTYNRTWRADPDDRTLCLINTTHDGSRPIYLARVEFHRSAPPGDFDLAELNPDRTVREPFSTLAEAKKWCAAAVIAIGGAR